MGVNDAAEQLEVALAEYAKLEGALADSLHVDTLSAVLEAYTYEGAIVWLRNWALATEDERKTMSVGPVQEWSGLPPDPAPRPVRGYCPMCGQTTLVSDEDNQVRCTNEDCGDELAAHKILDDHEIAHVVRIEGGGRFHVRHPLHERIGDALLHCRLHEALSNGYGRKYGPGVYRGGERGGEVVLEVIPQ